MSIGLAKVEIYRFLFATWPQYQRVTWICGRGPLILSDNPAKFGVHRPYGTGNNGVCNISSNSNSISNSNSNAEVPIPESFCILQKKLTSHFATLLWRANIFFFSTRLRYIIWFIKRRTRLFINLSSIVGFLNNSIRVYPRKLKNGMFHHMNNTFWNTAF